MEISRVITVIVLLKILFKTGMGSDFCDSFTKNQYRIDYVLSLDWQNLLLFIDYNYWQISQDSGVQLVSTESEVSYLFGKQHTLTFAGHSHKEASKLVIGVFNSFEQRIYWRLYSSDKFEKYLPSIESEFKNFVPNISFHVNDTNIICFLQQTNQSKEFRYFEFNTNSLENTNILSELKDYSESGDDIAILKDIEVKDDIKIIGIHFTNSKELGYLVLFLSYNNIQYCFTAKGCQMSDLYLVIECGKPCHFTNVFIVGIIILSFLAISSIVINIIMCYQFPKSEQSPERQSNRFSTKTEFNGPLPSSVATVDEVTGEPLRPKVIEPDVSPKK